MTTVRFAVSATPRPEEASRRLQYWTDPMAVEAQFQQFMNTASIGLGSAL